MLKIVESLNKYQQSRDKVSGSLNKLDSTNFGDVNTRMIIFFVGMFLMFILCFLTPLKAKLIEMFNKCWDKCCCCCHENLKEKDIEHYKEESIFFPQCYDVTNPLTAKHGTIRFLSQKIKYLEKLGKNDEAEQIREDLQEAQ